MQRVVQENSSTSSAAETPASDFKIINSRCCTNNSAFWRQLYGVVFVAFLGYALREQTFVLALYLSYSKIGAMLGVTLALFFARVFC
ncbi:uncharacterized protein BDR25DRAFT_354728 [Lindgomyces ingoldianus]|uniref:Uncharacterized protein n=1 Tax=Lindgomyces ingoldianus TaxID=673940 RepID=A0ACB6QYX6_9PLEO|nr:uncharacterized protein BDR25DRAFT_354728 [Lindgomyces ingoldianus]KAF2471477.1 hypothetical protein BDR25DRAFT_354728 [Lindgomyces ingoldianus]